VLKGPLRIGEWRAPEPNSNRGCQLCGRIPAGIQFVEISFFRREDEEVAACKPCKKNLKREIIILVENRLIDREFERSVRALRRMNNLDETVKRKGT
jgi:hypothetical protein